MDFKKDFPVCNQLANEVRDVFGSGVKLIKATENGQVFSTSTSREIDQKQSMDVDEFIEARRQAAVKPKRVQQ